MFAYRFRIYPNKRQEELILKTFGCCRFVYNYYLTKRIDLYKETIDIKRNRMPYKNQIIFSLL